MLTCTLKDEGRLINDERPQPTRLGRRQRKNCTGRVTDENGRLTDCTQHRVDVLDLSGYRVSWSITAFTSTAAIERNHREMPR